MRLKDLESLELPPSADMHVHLRQDRLMELVVSQIRNGGVDTVFVMVCHELFRQAGFVLFVDCLD
jgi:dihydroorotase